MTATPLTTATRPTTRARAIAAGLPTATPIGWDPTGARAAPGSPRQPLLFDSVTSSHHANGSSALPPAVTARVRQLAVVTVEVLAGRRPAGQLARWTTEPVQAHLTLATRRAGGRVGLQVASVHCQSPVRGVIEAALRVRADDRSVAMAFQLRDHHGRWLCTAWELRSHDLIRR